MHLVTSLLQANAGAIQTSEPKNVQKFPCPQASLSRSLLPFRPAHIAGICAVELITSIPAVDALVTDLSEVNTVAISVTSELGDITDVGATLLI